MTMDKLREQRCVACRLKFLPGELYRARGPQHFVCPTATGTRGIFRMLREVWRP